MRFSKLVEHVSKKPILPHVKHLLVEVMLMDEEGEDVEVSHTHPFRFESGLTLPTGTIRVSTHLINQTRCTIVCNVVWELISYKLLKSSEGD